MENKTVYAIADSASNFASLAMKLNLALTKVYDGNITEEELVEYCRKEIQNHVADAMFVFNGILTDGINP